MTNTTMNEQTRKYAAERAHFKARQLLGKYGFTEADFEDLQQELLLHVLKHLPNFDSGKASIRVFVTTLIDKRIANLVEDQEADCRDWRRVERSLDDPVPDEGEDGEDGMASFGDTISEDQGDARLGVARHSREDRADLAMDLARALQRLTPRDRQLCELLKEYTAEETARLAGVDRSHVHRRIKAIREVFTNAGLGEYFQKK